MRAAKLSADTCTLSSVAADGTSQIPAAVGAVWRLSRPRRAAAQEAARALRHWFDEAPVVLVPIQVVDAVPLVPLVPQVPVPDLQVQPDVPDRATIRARRIALSRRLAEPRTTTSNRVPAVTE